MELINIDKKKCKICYSCVRSCPVKAIVVKADGEYPEVLHDRCIGCGSCIDSCDPGALIPLTDYDYTKHLLKDPAKTAVIIDPAFVAEFAEISDFRKIIAMLKMVGFDFIFESSFGADLVAAQYYRLFKEFKGKFYLTSICPSIVAYVTKYYPNLTGNLAPICTPIEAMARVIRKKIGNNINIVAVSPCVSVKFVEKTDEKLINSYLTFRELRKLFKEYKISDKDIEYADFDLPVGIQGCLSPLSNGVIQASGLTEEYKNTHIMTFEGKRQSLQSIKDFDEHINTTRFHFNSFYNEGCIMGPGMTKEGNYTSRKAATIWYSRRRSERADHHSWENAMREYVSLNLQAEFAADDQRLPMPTAKQIESIIKELGKDEGVHHACNLCGYCTCEEMATAVAQGLATPGLCLRYSNRKVKDYAQDFRMAREQLLSTQQDLKESIDRERELKDAAMEAINKLNTLMQNMPEPMIIVSRDLKIVHSNDEFVSLLGDDARDINDVVPGLIGADLSKLLPFNICNLFNFVLDHNEAIQNRDMHIEDKLVSITIFPIPHSYMTGAIFRDLYVPEVRKDQAVKMINEVIDRYLQMVQKIGFILGDEASETERMLNSIIEAFESTGKKNK